MGWPLYKLRKVDIGKNVRIEKGAFLSKSTIGKYTYIGHYSMITDANVGNYCSIAAHVMIGGLEHSHWWWSTSPRLSDKGIRSTTVIGHDVWIGTKATIRQGVTIGDGAVIGSNAVVLDDVEPYSIVVGIPAKEIKKRFQASNLKRISGSNYHKLDPVEAKKILENLHFENDTEV